ncbi:MAG TPA: hypothetical protein PLY86_22275 [bacterium]|nr:hypothetical protein [bacterium]
MIDILSYLVPLFLGWGLLSILYWSFARRLFHDVILFRIFQKRDQLRSLAIEGRIDAKSYAYDFLERRLCQTAYASPKITICNFIRFCLSYDSRTPSPDLDKFLEEAPDNLKKIWALAIDDVKWMMLANSPIFAVVGFIWLIIEGLRELAIDQVRLGITILKTIVSMGLHRTATDEVKHFFEMKIFQTSCGDRAA